MTLEQLKERVKATCNKNGIFPTKIFVRLSFDKDIKCDMIMNLNYDMIHLTKPNTDLLLEAVDLECRAIKARQSSATNGIDE